MAYSIEYYKKYEPIFGDWKIVREIGSGSFGKVFEIQREDFGKIQTAALKVITIPQDGDFERLLGEGHTEESAKTYIRDIVRGVVNEFEFMSDLSGNTNIVDYKDHKTYEHEDGNSWDIFIRMELLTPITAITKKREFTENEVIKLGKDMCRALELCRKKDIIHRDIKPENIFTNENGDFKLGDFGVARQAEKTQSGMTKTGTLTYMAPEVYRGEKYGASVDIYSLGMVMYRLLNHNRAPFLPPFPQALTHTDMEVAFSKRINGEMLPMPSGECSHELCNIILKACAFRSEDRFESAEELRKALESIGKAPVANMHIPEQQPQKNLSDNETVRVQRVQAEAQKREEIKPEVKAPKKKKSKVRRILATIFLVIFGILFGLYLIGISVEDQSEVYSSEDESITQQVDDTVSLEAPEQDNDTSNKEEIYETYKYALNTYYNYSDYDVEYTLFDIDNNGIPELFFHESFSWTYQVYTFDNNNLVNSGEINAKYGIMKYGDMLLAKNGGTGCVELCQVQLNEALKIQQYVIPYLSYEHDMFSDSVTYLHNHKEISESEYMKIYNNMDYVKMYPKNDLSLLEILK